ncbi:hypothetical protein W97_01669 [Coniosporium apollinis CBS 100218]|uniref:C2H2-type domain-containing protein n=1 Tax=Coniosporium apollinis (strain CBS 100218) TaxID=1168221 RepID=R7YKJ9_CONA1|nr:uncharacterized protein W97_01669 [Coniosporium apollinis CBS 100218]EON62447.1 hypothetical protein W97_01669 [Coniosporium apollinis CBS 100218]
MVLWKLGYPALQRMKELLRKILRKLFKPFKAKVYVCPFCPDGEHNYPRPDNLQRHVRVHHIDRDKDDPALREVLERKLMAKSRGKRRRAVEMSVETTTPAVGGPERKQSLEGVVGEAVPTKIRRVDDKGQLSNLPPNSVLSSGQWYSDVLAAPWVSENSFLSGDVSGPPSMDAFLGMLPGTEMRFSHIPFESDQAALDTPSDFCQLPPLPLPQCPTFQPQDVVDDPSNLPLPGYDIDLYGDTNAAPSSYALSTDREGIRGIPIETESPGSSKLTPTFQCTFCHKAISYKAWKRHEEAVHLPQFQWVCQASGPLVASGGSLDILCAFCKLPNPSNSHFSDCHRAAECFARPAIDRSFPRKDNLKQHWKNVHQCELTEDVAQHWRRTINYEKKEWGCGFCGQKLESWDVRAVHIAQHFREGCTMASWDSNRSVIQQAY